MANPLRITVPQRMRGIGVDDVPKLEEWDPEGDVTLPRNAGAEIYVPPLEAAPPQLPEAEHRHQRKDFEPHGLKAFWNNASADLAPQDLGFTAHAVLVDNYSPCWLFFPDARTWVPPFVWHAVLSLQGSQVATWQRMAPTGGAQPSSTAPITTVWYEDYLSPSTGATVTLEPNETVFSDASGTVALGGADQVALAANPNRRYMTIQNISTAVLYVNFGAAATAGAGSIQLQPGGSMTMETDAVSTDAIHIFGATTGQAYTIKWA